ncbi:cytochrome c oxidase assembly factor CtaG [Paenibacillus spongiae]|uniref:Cytochrome c oxidase assembly factor CtaG n=1 Tax=Paenibacillus spongiae TaxID=2909671 RepID=A0ABY5SM62_9BACL|nr:cytochrome c oxidase assembly factor CtaG [Paenibacillus spongiae]UVI33760.1 cytochrome c oxidase assembly factor CtaG [Paenibacillus spongiae]
MLGLEYFSFEELWSPLFFFFMAALVILYFYLIGPWKEKHAPDEPQVTKFRKSLFVLGMILFYLAHGGPLDLLGHIMFSFHMTNMSLSYLIAPPLILLGVPAYLFRAVFGKKFWRKLSIFMHPIFTLVAFNMLFSIYHVPLVHDYVMTNFTVHRLYYIALLVTSFMMWWQIVEPVREWSRLADVKKMAYIFANGLLLTPACALIIFAGAPLYATYSDPQVWAQAMGYCVSGDPSALLASFNGPSFFSMMKPVEDQQTGGIIMKLVQEVMYGAILAYVFKAWYKREHADDEMPNPGAAGPAGANS